MPVKIAKKMEKIQCCFLWGDEEGNRRYHLVKWENLKRPFTEGGLGLRSIAKTNIALQGHAFGDRLERMGDCGKG